MISASSVSSPEDVEALKHKLEAKVLSLVREYNDSKAVRISQEKKLAQSHAQWKLKEGQGSNLQEHSKILDAGITDLTMSIRKIQDATRKECLVRNCTCRSIVLTRLRLLLSRRRNLSST